MSMGIIKEQKRKTKGRIRLLPYTLLILTVIIFGESYKPAYKKGNVTDLTVGVTILYFPAYFPRTNTAGIL